MSDRIDISDSRLRSLRYQLHRRAVKCAEEGFNVDSGLFERAADAIEAMQKERRVKETDDAR